MHILGQGHATGSAPGASCIITCLHGADNITRIVLFCVAAGLWILYLYEVLFRSGKIQKGWVKKRLAEVGLMLLVALVTVLIFTLVNGMQFGHKR